jgi:hypothetical protein
LLILVSSRDVHGGAVAVGFGKIIAAAFFFENIENLHEFGRISVFKNETS